MRVERSEHAANVVLAGEDGDFRGREPLIAREDELGALELDGVRPVPNDALELLSFFEG